jgi:predicted kinase
MGEMAMADGQAAVVTAGGSRRDRINVAEKYELRDWAICLDTPASDIEAAVRVVGDRVETVVTYLQERSRAA